MQKQLTNTLTTVAQNNSLNNCNIVFIYVTPEHNPKDFLSPQISSENIINAITTNLEHTRSILDDCQITLITNNKALIPFTVNAFEKTNIAVNNFANYSFPPEYKLPSILHCLTNENYRECLKNLLCPEGSIFCPSEDFLFGNTVNVVKQETSANLAVITTDINTIFCGKFSQEQLAPGAFHTYPIVFNEPLTPNTPWLVYEMATIKDLQNPNDFCRCHPNILIGDGKMGSWKHPDGTDINTEDYLED